MKQIRIVFIVGLLLTILVSFPVWRKPAERLFGYPGDALGLLGRTVYLQDKSISGGGKFVADMNFPFGFYLPKVQEVLSLAPVGLISHFANEVSAYNIWLLLSFPLTTIAMFILLRYLIYSFWPSLWGSLIFTFAPYHFWHSFSHISLAHIQWLPVFVLALLGFDDKPSRRRAFFLILSFLLVFFTSFYYGYFMLITAAVFFALRIIYDFCEKGENYLTRQRLIGFLWTAAFGIIFFAYPAFLAYQDYQNAQVFSVEKSVYQRDFEQLLYLSARPWDYLLPSANNPFFGKLSENFRNSLHLWESSLPRRNFFWIDVGNLEGTLFLGFTPLILAFYAIGNRKRTRLQKEIFIFAALALIAFFFSLPPFIEIGKFKLVLPSMFLSWLTLIFRTIARWGMVVMLFISMLAAIGLDVLLKNIKQNWQKRLITVVAFALLTIEFINVPPFHFTDISKTPAEYEWLAEKEGDFVIAEYELDDNIALFFQRIHGKKLLARYYRERLPLHDPDSREKLRKLGVAYVLFHKKSPFDKFNPTNERAPVGQVLPPPAALKEYKMVFSADNTLVFEL
ncbi:MAG: hypothetical protein FJ044_01655 [Candidatus Cloacimonetes bacterium]|nr:hypothetical protein [Candidatus Cloacimonadota bacterium]